MPTPSTWHLRAITLGSTHPTSDHPCHHSPTLGSSASGSYSVCGWALLPSPSESERGRGSPHSWLVPELSLLGVWGGVPRPPGRASPTSPSRHLQTGQDPRDMWSQLIHSRGQKLKPK